MGLSELRKKKGFSTVVSLAEAAGIERHTLYRLETGDFVRGANQSTVQKLSKALGVPRAKVIEQIEQVKTDKP